MTYETNRNYSHKTAENSYQHTMSMLDARITEKRRHLVEDHGVALQSAVKGYEHEVLNRQHEHLHNLGISGFPQIVPLANFAH